MAREEYNKCMVPWIKGKEGLDRRMSFCVGAKLCSGKAKTQQEAEVLCKASFNKKAVPVQSLLLDELLAELKRRGCFCTCEVPKSS